MRFAERLKKVVRDNFVDISPASAEIAVNHDDHDAAYNNGFTVSAAAPERVGTHAFHSPPMEAEVYQANSVLPEEGTPAVASASWSLAAAAEEPDVSLVIGENGEVDFDRLFASPNPPRFTARQAAELIAALPLDLPLRVKRLTVKASVETLAETSGITAAEAMQSIVGDAAQKMLRVARLQEAVEAQISTQKKQAQAELTDIQAQNESYLAAFRAQNDETTVAFCQQTEQAAASLEKEITDLEAQISQLQVQVADLQRRLSNESQLLEAVAEQNEAKVAAEVESRALLLQAETDVQTARLEQVEKWNKAVHRACKQRMNALNDVVLFFDEAAMGVSPATTAEDGAKEEIVKNEPGDELPAFMREDTAIKLLGIQKSRNTSVPALNTN